MRRDFKRLQPIHRLARMREDGSARDVAVATSRLLSEKEKLSALMTYRGEYDQTIRKSGVTGMQLRSAFTFLTQLSAVIDMQQQQMRDGEESLSRETQSWLSLQADRKAIERLIEKRWARQRVHLENLDQDQMDENSQRSYR